ncbi:MAG: hypothetical protein ACI9CB_001359 [Rhodothermales bacterium]
MHNRGLAQITTGLPEIDQIMKEEIWKQNILSPNWHLFNCSVELKLFKLAWLEEEDYRTVVFLDQRMNIPLENFRQESFGALSKLFPKNLEIEHPAAYIFHVGHCGSTLLSRALSIPAKVLPVREPLTLRFLAEQMHNFPRPTSLLSEREYERLSVIILSSLERRFADDQLPIIKATSTCNNLIGPILETQAQRRAILMFQSFESYLAGRFKNRQISTDLRVQAKLRMEEWLKIPGAPPLNLSDLSPPQLVALAWLTSMYRILTASEQFPEQTFLLDFTLFLEAPDQHLSQLAEFLGLAHEKKTIVDGYQRVSTQYSKSSDFDHSKSAKLEFEYTPETRLMAFDQARRINGEQIKLGVNWVKSMIKNTPALAKCSEYLE